MTAGMRVRLNSWATWVFQRSVSHYYTCTNFDFVCSLHWSSERVKVWLFIVLHQSWLPPQKRSFIGMLGYVPLLYEGCQCNFNLRQSKLLIS